MSIEVELAPEEISAEDLIKVYQYFCRSYNLKPTMRDISYLHTQGLPSLRSRDGLEYQPYMGVRFFGKGIGGRTQFRGYSSFDEMYNQTKEQEFRHLVLDYFTMKRQHRIIEPEGGQDTSHNP